MGIDVHLSLLQNCVAEIALRWTQQKIGALQNCVAEIALRWTPQKIGRPFSLLDCLCALAVGVEMSRDNKETKRAIQDASP
ncbi:hypothetical protein BgiBS90_004399, partial [Biomphalaria glabrata]